jgi:hypothetical protein
MEHELIIIHTSARKTETEIESDTYVYTHITALFVVFERRKDRQTDTNNRPKIDKSQRTKKIHTYVCSRREKNKAKRKKD